MTMSDRTPESAAEIPNVQAPKVIDFEVDMSSREEIMAGAAELFRLALPEWKTEEIHMEDMSGGLTNTLLKCEYKPEQCRLVLRIYGKNTESYIDRKAGLENVLLLNRYGLAPKIYFVFKNGLCSGFFDGETIDHAMLYDKAVYSSIAKLTARMHNVPLEGAKKACAYPMTVGFSKSASEALIRKLETALSEEFGKPVDLGEELREAARINASLKSDIVFCHNDLLIGNILKNGEEVHFIDYEYSSPNFQAFDIGNLFSEFCSVGKYDRSLYPSEEYQLEWIRIYLTEYRRLKCEACPTEQEVYDMFVEASKCALLSMLLWSFWSLLQEENSSKDFDFFEFALRRLGFYLQKKEEFLSL